MTEIVQKTDTFDTQDDGQLASSGTEIVDISEKRDVESDSALRETLVTKHMKAYFEEAVALGLDNRHFVDDHLSDLIEPVIRLAHLAGEGVPPQEAERYAIALVEHIEKLIYQDKLTGLLNRTGFEKALHDRFPNSTPVEGTMVFYVDLNDFKKLNDSEGHDQGDRVLEAISMSLQEAFQRDSDIIARGERSRESASQLHEENLLTRVGGDEIIVVIPPSPDTKSNKRHSDAQQQLKRIKQAVADAGEAEYGVTAAVGVSIADGDSDITVLLQKADEAMQVDKGDKSR